MSSNTTSPTILIRENALLPTGLVLETEAFLPGWRAVRNLNGHGVSRKIAGAKWNFFFLAGAIRTTVLGREGLGTLRRAVKRVLAKQRGHSYNALQIARVVPKSFLGIPYVSVSAHSRHIQESMYLVPVEDFRMRDAAATPPAAASAIVLVDDEKAHPEKAATVPQEELILNS
jgi:hypothetical protein